MIREYKERHPERFGVQPVKEKRGWWGRRRKGEGGDAKGNNKREKDVEGRGEKGTGKGGRDEKKGGKGEGDMMEKVTKKETSDHIFIPLRDEAFGASYGQEPGGGR